MIFPIIFPRISPGFWTSPEALKRAAEHAVNVTYVTQRVFLNGADVRLGSTGSLRWMVGTGIVMGVPQ